mgnify:CR=1 FL=1
MGEPFQSEQVTAGEFIAAANPAAVLALIAENERLKTLRSTTERDLAQELEVWKHGPSCWNCGDTGDVHDMVGEWRGQCDCNAAKLIDVSSERDRLRAENETLRKDAELLQSATDFVQKLCDSAGKQPSVATGYLHDILSALGKGEQS